ncbi:MAG: polysaccharide pyruvyl transferase family protein [Deltaproteobacteria bacterium]|nr:polysaccharide pyruvyl transferase family protein [Deltaproteobacteria bacterium]
MNVRILLINDNSAHVNWGAQASPPALATMLAEGLPGCTITTLSHAWLVRPHYRRMRPLLGGRLIREEHWQRVRPFINRCSVPVPFYPEVADDFDYWADKWLAGRGGPQAQEFLALAGSSDLIIYNGENSIYRNTPEGCHGIFLLWLAKTRLGKPSCIVNHTAHLNDVRPIMSGMVKLAYPQLDLVAVRESCSLASLQALGIKNAELFPDVVFSLAPGEHARDRVDEWRRRCGLGDQTYFCLSASGLPVSMPRGAWDGEITALVRDLKSLGLQAVLVAKDPWCLPLAEAAKRTDSLFFGPEHEFYDLWPLFQGASFLVTGHYHYAIFGAMVGCPFVPLSVNNHKMQGLCELLEWDRTVPFDATLLRSCRGEIVNEARWLWDERSKVSERLLKKAAALRDEARRLGPRIARTVRYAETGCAVTKGEL